MTVYDYSLMTYHITGMSVINDLKGSGQEGIILYLRSKDAIPQQLQIFLPKRDCAHIAKITKAGRKWWKGFRLPKMVEQ